MQNATWLSASVPLCPALGRAHLVTGLQFSLMTSEAICRAPPGSQEGVPLCPGCRTDRTLGDSRLRCSRSIGVGQTTCRMPMPC